MLNLTADESSKSIFAAGILKLKLGLALKECEKLKNYAKKKSDLTKDDYMYNLLISSPDGKSIDKKYFLFKGSHSDGRLKKLKKFTYRDSGVELISDKIKLKIVAVDAFSKNAFLYQYREDDEHVYGKLIKKIKDKKHAEIVFVVTRKEKKIHKKNINNKIFFDDIEGLINKYGY
ncbi:MAG: hypothetical protein PHX70_02495 [Clostridium sp.]|nr:hypothetical protein [Clostridium sp.]